MVALSAGETGSAGEAGVDAAYDECAREAGSAGEEGVNAGCGDSAEEGLDWKPWGLMGGGGRQYVLLLCICLFVSFFCFFWAIHMTFSRCLLRVFFFAPKVGYAKPCWRDGDGRISNAASCQYGRID